MITLQLPPGGTPSDASTRRTLNSLGAAVAKSKRIVVVTGAGISCSSGIPDFRSSDGLYNLVKSQYPSTVVKGADLFDAGLFRSADTTSLFYTFAAELKASVDKAAPSPTHKFLHALETRGKLLRTYTQNIDCLEERVGMRLAQDGGRVVQLHGSLSGVRCATCAFVGEMSEERRRCFARGEAPACPDCEARAEDREARGKRSIAVGVLRPGIVLYNEAHPGGDEIGDLQQADALKKPDLLIIMGTSLKVHGFKQLVKSFSRAVHASRPAASSSNSSTPTTVKPGGLVVFVNATPAAGKEWEREIDYFVQGSADDWVRGVLEQWKCVRPGDWESQTRLSFGVGKAAKEVVCEKEKGKGAKAAAVPTKPPPRGAENKPPGRKPSLTSAPIRVTIPPSLTARQAQALGKKASLTTITNTAASIPLPPTSSSPSKRPSSPPSRTAPPSPSKTRKAGTRRQPVAVVDDSDTSDTDDGAAVGALLLRAGSPMRLGTPARFTLAAGERMELGTPTKPPPDVDVFGSSAMDITSPPRLAVPLLPTRRSARVAARVGVA